MHELINFACNELEELERKAKRGNISMSDIQYADTLAHMKKNLLAGESMMGGMSNSSYARGGGSRDGYSMAGGSNMSEDNFRYSQARGNSNEYSRANSRHNMVDKIEFLAQSAVDEEERRILMDCANKLK